LCRGFNQFRLGTWPDRFPGVQFSDKPEAWISSSGP
jgi:hypothetical protein